VLQFPHNRAYRGNITVKPRLLAGQKQNLHSPEGKNKKKAGKKMSKARLVDYNTDKGDDLMDIQKYIDRLDQDRRDMELRLNENQEKLEIRLNENMGKLETRLNNDRQRFEQQLREDRQLMEQRIEVRLSEERRLSEQREDRMEKRFGEAMSNIKEAMSDIKDARNEIRGINRWVMGICIATVLGIAAMVITAIAN
jgi:hypothetical protein